MPEVTIISDDVRRVAGRVDGARILVDPDALPALVGWELKASGLCRADRCTPAPALADAGDAVDIGEVAAALGRAVVLEPGAAIAAVALDAEARRRALDGLEAPEFELPDLNGSPHALSEWHGTKRLLVTFSSWCGCRYDLPGWQAVHDELGPEGFTALAVAIDDDPEVVRPWTEGIGFPVLIDRHHVLTELYAISNVPTVVWIDEEDRIVRPNGVAFGTDTFADFTGVPAGPHLNALRDWVRDGTVPMGEDEARAAVGDLSQDEVRARLHFRVGAEARRQGDDAAATAHFAAAAELAPYDWTVRRAAMPLMGEDPFGERFLALYDEWQDAGMPYHGMVGQLDPSVPGSSAR